MKNEDSLSYDPEILLFAGICYLEMGGTDKAKANFEQIYNSTAINRYEGAWYLALTYLYEAESSDTKDNYDKIIDLLEEIPEGDSYYSKAQSLLGELKK